MEQTRKYITIVFSDLSNSTHLASTLEPEIYSDLLRDYRKVSERAVARHGGEIIRIDGDGLLAVYGHDTAYEDSARRAVETALDLRESISSLGVSDMTETMDLKLHTGIHGGVVLLREGDTVSGKYEILGEPTNIAKRLCDLAGPDEIMVSDKVLGAARTYFKFGKSSRVVPRGTSSALRVWPIKGRAEITSRIDVRGDRASDNFIGRETVMEELGQWAADRSGPRSALVTAGAGMGKSRLISEFLKREFSTSCAGYYASCDSYLGVQALQPIRQWLSDICQSSFGLQADRPAPGDDLNRYFEPEVSRLLNSFLSSSETISSSNVLKLFEAVLTTAHPGHQVMFCLDDWQWADQSTKNVILALNKTLLRHVKFLLASRDVDQDFLNATGAPHIALETLSLNEVDRLTQGMLGTASPFLLQKITSQSGGCPLYIEEICYALTQGADLSEGVWDNLSLASLTSARLAELEPEYIEVLHAASVLGFTFPQWLFEDITGVSVADPEFTELSKQDFLYIGDTAGTVRFKHALTQDAIYNMIAYRKRQSIHARVARSWLARAKETKSGDHNAIIALNLFRSGQFEGASTRALIAGTKALKAASLDVAQENFKLALQSLIRMPATVVRDKDITAALDKYGIASVMDPSKEHFDIIEKVADTFRDKPNSMSLAMTDYWQGYLFYGLGQPNRALEYFNRAKTRAMDNNKRKVLQNLNNNLAQTLAAACRYEEAKVYFKKVKDHERRRIEQVGSPISFAYSLSCEGFMLADEGLFDQADQCFDEAEMLCVARADHVVLSILSHRSAAEIWRGDFEQAGQYAKKVLSMTARMKSRYHFAMAKSLLNIASWLIEPEDKFVDELREMTSWMERHNLQQYISINYGYLSHMAQVSEDMKMCRKYASRAFRRARGGDRLGEAVAYRSLTRLFQHAGSSQKARAYFKRAQGSARLRSSAREMLQNQSLKESLILEV